MVSFILLHLLFAAPALVASFVPEARIPGRRVSIEVLNAQIDDSLPSFVRNPSDGSVLYDPDGNPLTVDRMLGTKPLRRDVLTRPGPRGRELVYITGETVISTLNQIFGYDGWNLKVIETKQVMREQDGSNNNAWRVVFTAHVRITLTDGTYKEDYGTGESMDRQLGAALQMALKASITDAVKRAARHFGDKLGNCLYQSEFNIINAPKTLREALDEYDKGAP